MSSSHAPAGPDAIIRSFSALLEAIAERAGPAIQAFLFTRDVRALAANRHLTTPLHAVRSVRLISFAAEAAAVASGLPAGIAWRPLRSVGLTSGEIASVVGITEQTLQRREERDEPLPIAIADRTMRLLRIIAEATDTFGDIARAMTWLRSPAPLLGGKTPLTMVETEAGAALIRQVLSAIATRRVPATA